MFRASTPLSVERVLVVAKTSRLQVLSESLGLTGIQLQQELSRRGYPVERMRISHEQQKRALIHMSTALRRTKIKYTMRRTRTLGSRSAMTSLINDKDLIVTAGGDGTMLAVAALVSGPDAPPILAVNTDPHLSAGTLCTTSLTFPAQPGSVLADPSCKRVPKADAAKRDFDNVLAKVVQGEYDLLRRTRIRTSITKADESSSVTDLPRLALNEVFYHEVDASRPSVHETVVDDRTPGHVQRSSGCIVATGTGSTAWMQSACALTYADASLVLARSGVHPDESQLRQIVEEVNQRCVFPPVSTQLEYLVREPVTNGWHGWTDLRLTSDLRRGFASYNVKLRSLGWDAALTMDGLKSYAVPYGATVEMSPAADSPLKCIRFY